MTFFNNILGAGKTVEILSTTIGMNEDGVNLDGVLNTFYKGLPGVTSSIVSAPITPGLLAGTDLFIDALPDAALTAAEIVAVKAFLAGGGTFFFLGENSNFTPTQDDNINADLTALGSGMKLTAVSIDGGLQTATVANGQVLSAPLTSGITSFVYAFTTGVTGGQELFLDTDKTTAFVAAELQVPEPSSILMLSIALAGAVLARRRSASRRLA